MIQVASPFQPLLLIQDSGPYCSIFPFPIFFFLLGFTGSHDAALVTQWPWDVSSEQLGQVVSVTAETTACWIGYDATYAYKKL